MREQFGSEVLVSRGVVGAQRVRVLVVLIAAASIAGVAEAQSPEATVLRAFAWTYPGQGVTDFDVAGFQIRIDGENLSPGGMSILEDEPESYFTPVLPMPVGQHLLEVRACNDTISGAWSAPLLFAFSFASTDDLEQHCGSFPFFDLP